MSVVDPAVTQTAITVMIVMLVTVVLNTMDRIVGRREIRDVEVLKNGYNQKKES